MTNQDFTPEHDAPTAIFMIGGPGAGKSYVRGQMFPALHVVDCDSWKERHPDYDPRDPSALHAWSTVQCNKEFFGMLSGDESFIYDGTGTNIEKMVNWMMQASTAGFQVQVVYVRCPMQTALERNRNRVRVVPEEIVREKHAMVETSFRIVSGYADEVTTVDNC